MNYTHAIDYLYGLQKHGIKLGLDNITRLLSLLRNPQNSFRALHIAGTNGKGSVSAMLASILRSAGFNVGLFTSPHLVSFTERIRVNYKQIKEEDVVALTDEIRGIIDRGRKDADAKSEAQGLNPTFFELVTAMAFLYFKRKNVQWAVVETGMGGRLDATNILLPEVSVITSISLDHREFLGATIREIAQEKAGIIKNNAPLVTSSQGEEASEILEAAAISKKAHVFKYGRDFTSVLRQGDAGGVTFDYTGKNIFKGLHVPMCGAHQMENASVALKAIELIMEKESISPDSVREGLEKAHWPGRLELMRLPERGYDILIDGAHNPSAAMTLSEALRDYFSDAYGRIIIILGIMSDKDAQGIMKPLLSCASDAIVTAPEYERASSPGRLAETARELGFCPAASNSVKDALEKAEKMADGQIGTNKSLIVITGSFYTIGEAMALLGRKGILTRLRE